MWCDPIFISTLSPPPEGLGFPLSRFPSPFALESLVPKLATLARLIGLGCKIVFRMVVGLQIGYFLEWVWHPSHSLSFTLASGFALWVQKHTPGMDLKVQGWM